jgi:hypothetical protein
MPLPFDPKTIGPVDVATILFEGNDFNGDVIPALQDLVDNGTVRILDFAFIRKDADGTATITEASDAEVVDAFAAIAGGQADLLNDEDLDYIATGLEPNSSAMVVVWENSWTSRFAVAVRESHGHLTAFERIPHDAVMKVIAALEQE